MHMKLKDGKSKVLTLSYDDGVIQDMRMIQILDQYGIKCTFNINTGLYFSEDQDKNVPFRRMTLAEAQNLYIESGHEVALHSLTHPNLEELTASQILTEILEDRKNIEEQYGTFARGMAYPFSSYDDTVIRALKYAGICYCRTGWDTQDFGLPTNWLTLRPTCHHKDPKLMKHAEIFVEGTPPSSVNNWMFLICGHTYEFDQNDNWNVIEEFASYIGGRDDIWYATNIEIYDYVKAYEALYVSVDGTMVYNPSITDVWFCNKGQTYVIHGGETLRI